MMLSLKHLISLYPEITIINDKSFYELGLTSTKYKYKKSGFTYLSNLDYLNELKMNDGVGCVLCRETDIDELIDLDLGLCVVEDPQMYFFLYHNYLATNTDFYSHTEGIEIDDSAQIHQTAVLTGNNISIGKNVIIEPNVTVHSNVTIDDNSIIRSGSVIGGSGFQSYKIKNEMHMVLSTGFVHIKPHVEISNNCCVDVGVFGGVTLIDSYSKIDNLVHIAHDVKIGKRCLITAHAIICGRAIIGNDVWIGVSSVIRNGISIGDSSKISLGSIVTQNVKSGIRVTGNFAIEHSQFIKNLKEIR